LYSNPLSQPPWKDAEGGTYRVNRTKADLPKAQRVELNVGEKVVFAAQALRIALPIENPRFKNEFAKATAEFQKLQGSAENVIVPRPSSTIPPTPRILAELGAARGARAHPGFRPVQQRLQPARRTAAPHHRGHQGRPGVGADQQQDSGCCIPSAFVADVT
jgi:hypothetical protein